MLLKDRLALVLSKPNKLNKKKNKAGLARACDISPSSVNDWFSGKSLSIDGKHLTRAAAYLECSAHWLSTGEGSMDQDTDAIADLSDPIGFMVSQYKYLLEHLPANVRQSAHRDAIDVLSMLVLQNERRAARDSNPADK